jgi:Zn-finger nucleic acid-binding protein
MTERRAIEIDYCPQCRGVWLDRGELDKLIAQDGSELGRENRREREDERERERGDEDRRGGYRTHKKKRSIFDIFDFD